MEGGGTLEMQGLCVLLFFAAGGPRDGKRRPWTLMNKRSHSLVRAFQRTGKAVTGRKGGGPFQVEGNGPGRRDWLVGSPFCLTRVLPAWQCLAHTYTLGTPEGPLPLAQGSVPRDTEVLARRPVFFCPCL